MYEYKGNYERKPRSVRFTDIRPKFKMATGDRMAEAFWVNLKRHLVVTLI